MSYREYDEGVTISTHEYKQYVKLSKNLKTYCVAVGAAAFAVGFILGLLL